jgi:hypothetical protein
MNVQSIKLIYMEIIALSNLDVLSCDSVHDNVIKSNWHS